MLQKRKKQSWHLSHFGTYAGLQFITVPFTEKYLPNYIFWLPIILLLLVCFFQLLSQQPCEGAEGAGVTFSTLCQQKEKAKMQRTLFQVLSPCPFLWQKRGGWGGSAARQLPPTPSLTSKTPETCLERQNERSTSARNSTQCSSRGQLKA